MPLDFEAFAASLDEMMDRIPAPLLRGLNGGVGLSEETRQGTADPPGVFTLGEYITDPHLGAMVLIYHGSFAATLAGEPEAVWKRELWTTLRHELRHHVEGAAGIRDLEVEDRAQLQRLRGARPRLGRLRAAGRLARPRSDE